MRSPEEPPLALVLGASGMLGSMVADVLSQEAGFGVRATVRSQAALRWGREVAPELDWRLLDAEQGADGEASPLDSLLEGVTCAVNAIGVIKPYIHDDNAEERRRAVSVNALFPHRLAAAAARSGVPVVQIATDCVYSGTRGRYVESDVHDALDVYGKSKSLGEVPAHVSHLRCSIVGPEPAAHVSLLDWFLHQPRDAHVRGFTNHRWNGVTTLHFARLAAAIVRGAELPAGVRHVVPADEVTKADLLFEMARAFGRTDVAVEPVEAESAVDRTLATTEPVWNRHLWKAAGYAGPPSITRMLEELAGFNYRMSGAQR